jgi:hypothetical protein
MDNLTCFIGNSYILNFKGFHIRTRFVGEGTRIDFGSYSDEIDLNTSVPEKNMLFFRDSTGAEVDGEYLGDGIVIIRLQGGATAVVNLDQGVGDDNGI